MTKPGIKEIALGRSDTYRVDPFDLHIKEGWNCRDKDFDPNDPEDLALAQSIKESGVKEALTVVIENGKLFVTNGHRRRAATHYAIETLGAEIKSVPVQTEERYSSEADQVFSQIVRNSGKPLSPIEQARVFKRLIELGWDESEIARKSGLNRAWVVDLLKLQAAPNAVTGLVRSGQVAATLAIQTLKANKGDAEKSAADLTQAVETARAAGKAHATAKHMGEHKTKPPSLAEQLRTFHGEIEIRQGATSGNVGLIMTVEQYERFKALIGLQG